MARRLPLAFLTAPFETCICVVLVVTQAYALITRQPPSAALATLPGPILRGYEAVTFLGALLVVTAAFWPDRLLAEIIERSGLWMVFGSFLAFALVILDLVGLRSVLTAGTYLALAAACLLRIHAIRKVRKVIEQTLHE